MFKKIILPSIFLSSIASGATPLVAGDIAFLGFNLDGTDDFAFVLLKDIDATTTIDFTDRGWNDGSGLFTGPTGEGSWSWSSGGDRLAGTVVTLGLASGGSSASIGSISIGIAPVFSNLGDQIFAYQGDGSLGTLIAGIHSDASPSATNAVNWSGSATGNQNSALPNTFVNGDQAVWLNNAGAEVDNWRYNATSGSSLTGTPADIRAQLHNVANWSSDNTNDFDLTPSNFGTFNVILVPEPSSILLLGLTAGFGLVVRRR